MTDRDLYTHSTLVQNPETKVIVSHTVGVPQYGPVNEDMIRDEWRIAYVYHENPVDLLTKPLPTGEKSRNFVICYSGVGC